jgi:hypothetical protein
MYRPNKETSSCWNIASPGGTWRISSDRGEMVYVITVEQAIVWQTRRDSGNITNQIIDSMHVMVNGKEIEGV